MSQGNLAHIRISQYMYNNDYHLYKEKPCRESIANQGLGLSTVFYYNGLFCCFAKPILLLLAANRIEENRGLSWKIPFGF